MPSSSRFLQLRAIALGAAILSLLAAAATAQEALRWKLQPGQTLRYLMTQTTDMAAKQAGGMGAQVEQQLDMNWHVNDVREDGTMFLEQTIDRVRMTMGGPFGKAEYDSAKDEAPPGMLAMAAPIYKAMMASTFQLEMSPRGETKEVEIPESLLEAIKNLPGAAAMGDMVSEEGFKRMMVQGAMTLPEEYPQEGQEWSSKTEIANPVFGKQIVEMTYTFRGTREEDGQTFAVFEPAMKMSFEGQGGMKAEIKEQQSSGEVLFNQSEGRLHSSKLDLNLVMVLTVAGQTIEQTLDQAIEVEVTPAEAAEAEPDEAAAPANETNEDDSPGQP